MSTREVVFWFPLWGWESRKETAGKLDPGRRKEKERRREKKKGVPEWVKFGRPLCNAK